MKNRWVGQIKTALHRNPPEMLNNTLTGNYVEFVDCRSVTLKENQIKSGYEIKQTIAKNKRFDRVAFKLLNPFLIFDLSNISIL